jgi:hypothetical protein
VLRQLKDHFLGRQYLPIYGLGHSLGCKIHLLIGSLFTPERAGNILMAFNNYPARRSIPFLQGVWDQVALSLDFDVEFTPSPERTLQLVQDRYVVRRNLLVKFRTDELDQTRDLLPVLQNRFPELSAMQRLAGNHLTPISQDVRWQAGSSFSPLDAVGQWLRQELTRDLQQLQREIAYWLSPLG